MNRRFGWCGLAAAGLCCAALRAQPAAAAASGAEVTARVMAALERADEGQPVDWDGTRQLLLSFLQAHPDAPDAVSLVLNFAYEYETAHSLEASAALWADFAKIPNDTIAPDAREKLAFFRRARQPIELTYTAIDGRTVDLSRLRGKVVLIDFWATWCGPCMQELPNVKRVYAKYHDRGFDIVGVSCDVAPENAGKNGAAWAKTKAQLLAFTQAHDLAWPQDYEGRKHNAGGNTLASQFAVTGIPAGFLLDKRGRIVALNVRGERLDREVARLLAE